MKPALLVAILALLLAGCAAPAAEPSPPDIAYGFDQCDLCGMLIDEPRFAAALLFEDGQSAKFDDLGDMLVYAAAKPESTVRAWFVHDYETETWLRGETAIYVRGASLRSPMGHGLVAFEHQAAAEAFAAALGGDVLSFDDLRDSVTTAGHAGHHHPPPVSISAP